MADHSRPWTRALAVGVFAMAAAELAAAVTPALAGRISFAEAVGSFTVTNGAMGLGFAACELLPPASAAAAVFHDREDFCPTFRGQTLRDHEIRSGYGPNPAQGS